MKFAIGDRVVHRSIVEEMRMNWEAYGPTARVAWLPGLKMPRIYIVSSIYVETCHGGCEQITYGVSHSDTDNKRWAEMMLVPAEEVLHEFQAFVLRMTEVSKPKKTDA